MSEELESKVAQFELDCRKWTITLALVVGVSFLCVAWEFRKVNQRLDTYGWKAHTAYDWATRKHVLTNGQWISVPSSTIRLGQAPRMQGEGSTNSFPMDMDTAIMAAYLLGKVAGVEGRLDAWGYPAMPTNGQTIRVTHPKHNLLTVTKRWNGSEWEDQ